MEVPVDNQNEEEMHWLEKLQKVNPKSLSSKRKMTSEISSPPDSAAKRVSQG